MIREYAFGTQQQAKEFIRGVLHTANQHARSIANPEAAQPMHPKTHGILGSVSRSSGIPLIYLQSEAQRAGGTPIYTSSRLKEEWVYDRQVLIHDQDRQYLYRRETTTRMIIDTPARDRWRRPPRTWNTTIDNFLSKWWPQIQRACMGADIAAARDGQAFVWIRTDAQDPSKPLGRERIQGFDLVRIQDTDKQEPVMSPTGDDPDEDTVGILRVRIDGGFEQDVHGSRVIDMGHDLERITWKSQSIIDILFDALWDMNDVVVSNVRNIEQGNPIVVSLDTDQMHTWVLTEEDEEEIVDDTVDWFSAGSQFVGPVKGLVVKRMGVNEVQEPDSVAEMLANRIAYVTPFSKNHILGNSRGSEQVTDADRIDYQSEIHAINDVYTFPILARIIRLAKRMGALPRKAPFDVSDVQWPSLRSLNERERAFIDKTDATTFNTALRSGHKPHPRIAERFDRIPEGEAHITDNILPNVSINKRLDLNKDEGDEGAEDQNANDNSDEDDSPEAFDAAFDRFMTEDDDT